MYHDLASPLVTNPAYTNALGVATPNVTYAPKGLPAGAQLLRAGPPQDIANPTKKSERKARAQVTPTETDGVVITEVDMGDTSGLMVRASVVQMSTIFYDTPATLGLSHFLCYQSVLARVLLV
ncbi:hypothetical protein Tco_0552872, partial [Tanacetum coccineum]